MAQVLNRVTMSIRAALGPGINTRHEQTFYKIFLRLEFLTQNIFPSREQPEIRAKFGPNLVGILPEIGF